MLIDTPWTKVSGVANPDISAWEWVVIVAAMLLLIGPLIVWKERWVSAWRWWQSVLFFVGFFCIAIPVVAGGADAILGDNHAKVDADGVVAQVLSARPSSVTRATAIVVQPFEHLAGSTLDVPYQGEGIDYLVDFAAVSRAGSAVQCRATLSLYREQTPRGRSAPVFARLKGGCRAAA
ncbi:hypothetical protein TPB0596_32580 [Tsukamurella pulmonis]|uniref:hypothetical protein n=1 Tax=Tsukamurella pulmonis TaxID=47312 RepID=UPI001EE150B6|nr:hypothetical protein [Tsukamurella pulmonis]BDD83495.1 hypothetical protein TPB0596_32580 [Tsukamurella pulmonis]